MHTNIITNCILTHTVSCKDKIHLENTDNILALLSSNNHLNLEIE